MTTCGHLSILAADAISPSVSYLPLFAPVYHWYLFTVIIVAHYIHYTIWYTLVSTQARLLMLRSLKRSFSNFQRISVHREDEIGTLLKAIVEPITKRPLESLGCIQVCSKPCKYLINVLLL